MSNVNLQEVHDFLVAIAHQAGDMVRSATPTTTGHGTKKNSADLVTETDQAVEDMVSKALREKYPDFAYDLLLSYYCISVPPILTIRLHFLFSCPL